MRTYPCEVTFKGQQPLLVFLTLEQANARFVVEGVNLKKQAVRFFTLEESESFLKKAKRYLEESLVDLTTECPQRLAQVQQNITFYRTRIEFFAKAVAHHQGEIENDC